MSNNGLDLSIKQSEVLNSTKEYFIGDEVLQNVSKFKYLGLFLNKEGIDFETNAINTINSSKNMLNFLKLKGLNKSGFGLRTATMLLKTFIVSRLNYGWTISNIQSPVINKLEKWFNYGLRCITDGKWNTSIHAMLIISYQIPFKIRLEELQARYLFSIKNISETYSEAPVIKLFQKNDKSKKLSTFHKKIKRQNIFYKNLTDNNNEASFDKKIKATRLELFRKQLVKKEINLLMLLEVQLGLKLKIV